MQNKITINFVVKAEYKNKHTPYIMGAYIYSSASHLAKKNLMLIFLHKSSGETEISSTIFKNRHLLTYDFYL